MAICFMFVFCICIMCNISFKAKLIVDDSLYKKMPVGTPEGYTDNLIAGYKKFLDNEVIQKVTQGDTIELYKAKYRPGFALGIRYSSDKFEKPVESGIHTNKKIPGVTSGSLIHDTMTFLICKSGINQRMAESTQKAFIRAVRTLLDEKKLDS